MKRLASAAGTCFCFLLASCAKPPTMENVRRDIHSFSNPEQIRVRNVDLDFDVFFNRKIISGIVTLGVERRVSSGAPPLIVDTRDLKIESVETADDSGTFSSSEFSLGASDPILGAPLTIPLPATATRVRIRYSTSPQASALQWLDPPQTAGKKQPFLFTQSQAINARSWIPLQDSPGVRVTYSAVVRTPKELVAVMSAPNDPNAPRNGRVSLPSAKCDSVLPDRSGGRRLAVPGDREPHRGVRGA